MKKIVFNLSFAIIFLVFPIHGFAQIEGMLDQQQLTNLTDRIAQAGKKGIAVVDFTDLQGNVTELGRFLAEEFSIALVSAGKGFEIIDRVHLRSILAEHKLALTGVIDPKTARQLGRIAGVGAIVTGSITPFGDNIRVSFKVLDTETAMIIAASSGNIARTAAINELLGRGIETGQPVSQQPSAPASPSYGYAPQKYPVVEDSYLRIVVLNVKKSGSKFVTVQLEYQNKTDKEIQIDYRGINPAVLVDDLGNTSKIGTSHLSRGIISPKGKKMLGLGFDFDDAKELGNSFNLNITHKSNPPGSISFTSLKTK